MPVGVTLQPHIESNNEFTCHSGNYHSAPRDPHTTHIQPNDSDDNTKKKNKHMNKQNFVNDIHIADDGNGWYCQQHLAP